MNIWKKIIALFLLGGSALFAVLIITGQKTLEIKIPKQLQATLTETKNETLADVPALEAMLAENLTEQAVQGISEQIIKKNPYGIQEIEGQEWLSVISPEEAVEKYFTDAVEKFDISQLKTPADESKLVIINDTSRTTLESYLKNFQTILSSNFKGLAISYANLTLPDISRLIAAYDAAIAKFYALPVPKNLLAIHKNQIALMNGQRNVFEALKNSDQDPLRAVLAAQANRELSQEFAVINKTLQDIIQKNNLTL